MLVASDYKHQLLKGDHCNYGTYSTLQNDIPHYTNYQQTYNSQVEANNTIDDWWDLPNTLSIAQRNKKREISHDILLLYETSFQFSYGFHAFDLVTRKNKARAGSSLFAICNVTAAEKPLYLHNDDIIIDINTIDSIKQMIEEYLKRHNKKKGEVIGPKITSYAANTKKEITITNVGNLASSSNQSTDIHLLQLAYQTIRRLKFFHLAVVPQLILSDMKWKKYFDANNIPQKTRLFSKELENFEVSSIYLFSLLLQQYAVGLGRYSIEIPLLWDKKKKCNKKYFLRFYFSHLTKRVNEVFRDNEQVHEIIYTISFQKYDNGKPKDAKRNIFKCLQVAYENRKSTHIYFSRNRCACAVISSARNNSLDDVMRRGMRNKILVKGYMRQLNSVYISFLHELIVSFYGS